MTSNKQLELALEIATLAHKGVEHISSMHFELLTTKRIFVRNYKKLSLFYMTSLKTHH